MSYFIELGAILWALGIANVCEYSGYTTTDIVMMLSFAAVAGCCELWRYINKRIEEGENGQG